MAAPADEPAIEDFVEVPAIIPKWAAALPSYDTDAARFLRAPARV
jgi:hypothetical protein